MEDTNQVQFDKEQIPEELRKWNWGAFLLTWIWGIGNKTYIAFLCLVPVLGLIMAVVLGVKGNEWAWQHGRWYSVDDFKQTQRKWSFVGVLTIIGIILMALLLVILFEVGLAKIGAVDDSMKIINNSSRVEACFGEPIKKGFFITGSVYFSGKNGVASLTIPIIGTKQNGNAYLNAKKTNGQWEINSLVICDKQFQQKIEIGNLERPDDIVLHTPPFNYYKADEIIDIDVTPIEFRLKSSKANGIIDEENWFLNNHISINAYQVPNQFTGVTGNLPNQLDKNIEDLIVVKAFHDDLYTYCIYGNDYAEGYFLKIYDNKTYELLYCFDFSEYRYSPYFIASDYDYIQQCINWAILQDGVLYVSNSHSTFAASSKNMNAYITAIKLTDMSVLWRTNPLVSNASNFLMNGDIIISGYGCTYESDYLYQINKKTGETISKISLKGNPTYFVYKDDVLYVRTYNTDYEFEIN